MSAWADRLREKRTRTQEHIRDHQAAQARLEGDERPEQPAHWGEDTVIGREPVGQGFEVAAPITAERAECLGILGLAPTATDDEVAVAFRQLAKQHHPDRWAAADAAVQAEHAEAMLRINAAYRTLRDAKLA